jgi:hypothetical protein
VVACNPTYTSHDYDFDADFSAYKTYNWMEQTTMTEGQPQTFQQSGLLEARIKRAVKEQLSAKGLTLDPNNPDLELVYHIGVVNITEIRQTGTGYGMGDNTRADQFQEGTFILDMVDKSTNKLVWRGIAEGVLEENISPEKLDKSINDMIGKLLKKYPPPTE